MRLRRGVRQQAVWLTCEYSVKHLLNSSCLIHPRTIRTRNWAIQMAASQKVLADYWPQATNI